MPAASREMTGVAERWQALYLGERGDSCHKECEEEAKSHAPTVADHAADVQIGPLLKRYRAHGWD
jgi:hypothetical protein